MDSENKGLKKEDFERINKDFNRYSNNMSKANIDTINNKIKTYKKDIKRLEKEIEALNKYKEAAKFQKSVHEKNGDKTEADLVQMSIDAFNSEIESKITSKNDLEDQIEDLQNKINRNKARVDKCIEELSKDSEFKKHVDDEMKKRLIRRSEKTLKENATLKNLQELIKLQPECEQNISEMKTMQLEMDDSNEKIEKLEEEIAKLDPITDTSTISAKQTEITNEKNKIDVNRKKYNTNKTEVKKAAKKHKVEIDEEILKRFIKDTTFKRDKSGTLQVSKTISNKIKVNEKTIKNDEIALSKLEGREIHTSLERDFDEDGNELPLDESHLEINSGKRLPAVRNKDTKWFQFIKRFKNWREERKNQRSLPKTEDRSDYEERAEVSASDKFKNSYKYDVVKEFAERREKEILNEAKQTIKKQKEEGR